MPRSTRELVWNLIRASRLARYEKANGITDVVPLGWRSCNTACAEGEADRA